MTRIVEIYTHKNSSQIRDKNVIMSRFSCPLVALAILSLDITDHIDAGKDT
jgi:hypothetical protein